MLNVIDEFTHECLATRVARKLKAIDVIDVLSDLFTLRGHAANVTKRLWEIGDIVDVLEAWEQSGCARG
jgi:hypothetical protein